MPFLDAKALRTDPEGLAFLRSVIAPPSQCPWPEPKAGKQDGLGAPRSIHQRSAYMLAFTCCVSFLGALTAVVWSMLNASGHSSDHLATTAHAGLRGHTRYPLLRFAAA